MSARSNRFFLGGLASFIIGHFCYGRALLGHGIQNLGIIFGLALSLLVTASLGHHLFVAAGRRAGSKLAFAVVMYLITLGSVVVLAIGTASVWIAYGGMIFAVSAISVTSYRFLSPKAWAQLAIVVGCHLGQALMLIGLAR
jgi:uncharacterized membrane protein YhhN